MSVGNPERTESDRQPDAASESRDAARRTEVVEAQLAAIHARFGDRFSEDERRQVRDKLARGIDVGERLRRVPLTNADEPELTIVPFRADRESSTTGADQ